VPTTEGSPYGKKPQFHNYDTNNLIVQKPAIQLNELNSTSTQEKNKTD